MDKGHSAFILSLGDKLLRYASKEKTTTKIQSTLEGLYMIKLLVNHLYVKQASYSFNMQKYNIIESQLNIFNKPILDIKNLDVTIDMKFMPCCYCVLYLSLSPISKKLSCMDENLYPGKVQATLNSKELNERNEQKASLSGVGLIVRGKKHHEKNRDVPKLG